MACNNGNTTCIPIGPAGPPGPPGTAEGGQVDSVVAGTNVTVDNTDPINPIISASGGGTVTSLDTLGTSGPSTLSALGVLNIPEYSVGGGVTSIVAGTNVTIDPTGGTGAVTINSSGGGGGFDGVFTDTDISAFVTLGGSATSTVNSVGLSYYIAGKTAFIGLAGSFTMTGTTSDDFAIANIDLSTILPSVVNANSFNWGTAGIMTSPFIVYNPVPIFIAGVIGLPDLKVSGFTLPINMTNKINYINAQLTLSLT